MASERMSTHYDPVDVVGHVLEECGTISFFKSFENFTNALGSNDHLNLRYKLHDTYRLRRRWRYAIASPNASRFCAGVPRI